jgi:hypothetical protein
VIRIVLVLCALAAPAVAANRYALVVGNDAGDSDEQRLRYAEHDADRFATTLVDLGGFARSDVVVMRGRDGDDVRAALIALNDRIRTEGEADSMLIVYYSGHADARALHLGTSELALSQLEQLVRGSPAAFRLLVVDACRSGSLTRVKGGRVAPAFPITLGDTLAAEGVVFWTATAASEDAQESDAIKGSFFSLFLVSGLAGPADADNDGTVTTTEAYDYARAATLRASSRTLAGMQHPTFRDELAGRGAVVLTRPGMLGPRRARLRAPAGRDVLVLAGGADGPVIAEVGAHDRTRQLNVSAGRYFIRQRLDTHLLEGTITIASGDDHLIADDELAQVKYERVAAKGVVVRARPDSIEAGLLVRTALVDGGDPCAGVIGGYAFELGWITLTPRISACRERARNAFLGVETDHGVLDVRVSHAWQLGRMSVAAQAQAGGALLHQQFATDGVAPARTTAAASFGGGTRLAIALGGDIVISAAVELDSFVLQQTDNMMTSWGSRLSLGGVLALGVGL